MATEEGFAGELLAGGSFSQLLNSNDVNLAMEESLIYSPSFTDRHDRPPPSKALLFGDRRAYPDICLADSAPAAQKSGGCDCSSTSSSSGCSLSKTRKAESGEATVDENSRLDSALAPDSVDSTAAKYWGKSCKKPRAEPTTSKGGKREKLGEQIAALQKLVSPFGKTDTASVLHEAMGYIRFLHDQVQVLSSPYMQRLPSSAQLPEGEEDEARVDLRSRGLCLVPVSCTAHVANSNGADFWSPAMGGNPTKSKH